MNNRTPRQSTAVITPADLDKRIEAKRAAVAEARAAYESAAAAHEAAKEADTAHAAHLVRYKAHRLLERRKYALAGLIDQRDRAVRRAAEATAAFLRDEAAPAPVITAEAKRAEAEAGARAMLAAAPKWRAPVFLVGEEAIARAEAKRAAAEAATPEARLAAAQAAFDAYAAARTASAVAAGIDPEFDPRPATAEGKRLAVALSLARAAVNTAPKPDPVDTAEAELATAAAAHAAGPSIETRERLIAAAEGVAEARTAAEAKPEAAPVITAEAAPLSGVDLQCLVNEEWNARCEVQSTAHRAEAAARDMGEGSPGHLYCLEEAAAAVKRAADLRARLAAARVRLA